VTAVNNLNTTPAQVIAANQNRVSISFHNPGTNDVFVYQTQTLVSGSLVNLVPSLSSLGGCYRIFGNGGGLTLTGECQLAFGAFSASGSNQPLTITESQS